MMRECFNCKAGYHWLSDDDFNKLKWQVRSRILLLLKSTYNMCGYQAFNDAVCEELMVLIEQSWKRIRGKDTMLKLPNQDRYEAEQRYLADD